MSENIPLHRFNKEERLGDYRAPREAVYCGTLTVFETSRGKGVLYDEETGESKVFESLIAARVELVRITKEIW